MKRHFCWHESSTLGYDLSYIITYHPLKIQNIRLQFHTWKSKRQIARSGNFHRSFKSYVHMFFPCGSFSNCETHSCCDLKTLGKSIHAPTPVYNLIKSPIYITCTEVHLLNLQVLPYIVGNILPLPVRISGPFPSFYSSLWWTDVIWRSSPTQQHNALKTSQPCAPTSWKLH